MRASSVLPARPWSEATIAATLACGGLLCGSGSRGRSIVEPVEKPDAVVFIADLPEPGADIAAQHQRVVHLLPVGLTIGDEIGERHAGKLDLLVGHLVELRDGDLDRVRRAAEV